MKGEMKMSHTSHTISRRLNSPWADILKGVLLGIAATAVLVALFALVISLIDISDSAVRTVNQGIKLLSIVLGVLAAVRPGDAGGTMRGALVGLVYMAAGVLVYALLTSQPLTAYAYLADLLLGVAAGGLTGMLRSRAV